MSCPNVNHPDYKKLVALYGETGAFSMWNEFEGFDNDYISDVVDQNSEQLKSAEIDSKKVESELESKMRNFFNMMGFSMETVESMQDKSGDLISAHAKADMTRKVVQVVRGELPTDVLPEEAAHIFVEALGEDSPLFKAMMDKVESYPVYQEVVEQYSYIYQGDTYKLKKEAVGKLIAQEIMKVSQEDNGFLKRWFQRVLSALRISFNKKLKDPYTQAAYDLMNSRLDALDKNNITEGEFYSLQTNKTREIIDRINKNREEHEIREIPNSELDDKHIPLGFEGTTARYYNKVTGETVTSRVTDKASKEFRKRMGEDVAKNISNKTRSIHARELGTEMHELAEELIKVEISGKGSVAKPLHLTGSQFTNFKKGVADLVAQAKETQNKIDPDASVTFLPEALLIDPTKDMGGSVDLLVIYSDGSAGLFDYKFITNFETVGKQGAKKVVATDVGEMKRKGFEMQISEYKRMLLQVYGVTKVRESRIVPVNMQLKGKFVMDNGKKVWKEIKGIDKLEIGGSKEYLQQIPLAQERTDDSKLNGLLESLERTKKQLAERLKSNYSDTAQVEHLKKRIDTLNKGIQGILVQGSVEYVLEDATNLVVELSERIGIEDPANPDYMSFEDINMAMDSLKVYGRLGIETSTTIQKLKESDPDLYEDLSNRLGRLSREVDIHKDLLIDKIHERMKDEGYGDVSKPAKEISAMSRLFTSLNQISHPIFQAFSKLVTKAIGDTKRKMKAAEEEIQETTNALEDWARANGMSLMDAYRKMINPDTGNLWAEFKSELYAQRDVARDEQDIEWMMENYHQTAEDKKRFEENKKEYFDMLERVYGRTYMVDGVKKSNKSKVTLMKNAWLAKYDLTIKGGKAVNPTAWFNRKYMYASIKDTSKWQSEEFKYIQSNAPMKAFYEMNAKFNEEFNEILPDRVSNNFVANIRRDTLMKVVETGSLSLKGMGSSYLDGLEAREDDTTFGMIDPATGKPINKIPVHFTNADFKDGKLDLSNKSIDLGRNLAIFSKMAYNYEHMSGIEAQALALRNSLTDPNRKELITDSAGNKLVDKITNTAINAIGQGSSLETFDRFMKSIVYGQKVQSKDVVVPFLGKNISLTKVIKGSMSWFSAKSLSMNFISAGASYMAAKTNTYMEGAKGTHYTNKNMRSAHKRLISNTKEYHLASEYFDVSQEDSNMRTANNLSASRILRGVTMDNLFILHSKGDNVIDNSILNAMLESHGIDESGMPTHLELLPEGSKSMLELQSLQGDKIHYEGLSEAGYDRFRTKVRYVASTTKGNMSDENTSTVKTYLLGNMLMQFRSWMPRMVEERFKGDRYNQDIENYEVGRYIAFGSQFTKDTFMPMMGSIIKGVMTFGVHEYKGNPKAIASRFIEFKRENPDSTLTLKGYTKVMQGQNKAMILELRVILGVLSMVFALGAVDDEEYPALAKVKKLIERIYNELSFFMNPLSMIQVIKSPIPMLGFMAEFADLIANTGDEIRDEIWGENSTRDRTPNFYKSSRMLPGVSGIVKTFDLFSEDTDDEDE